ncbi:MAG: sulfatase-like hydrolase/transferase [Vicinamibacterales bacterium]
MIDRSPNLIVLAGALIITLTSACRTPSQPPPPPPPAIAQSVLLMTIDTLRADAVGAYGGAARTPTLDALARDGARVDRAWTTAPITLTAHASMLTGLYPPGHGARHNGIAAAGVPTLADSLKGAGFATAAFVSAFPLDHRFGLARGFDVYDDELPRDGNGRPLNERAGADTVTRAAAWLAEHRQGRFFLWVHLFEPHAPYGNAGDPGSARQRYASDVAIADREAGRLIASLQDAAASTLVIAVADHGEAFGEHEEIGHSIFVYDTTLRIPLLMRGPGVPAGVVVNGDASLVDLPPTIAALTGTAPLRSDGVSLTTALGATPIPARQIYAESFAPLYDFGWAGLRAIRNGAWKYISAPKPELFDTGADPHEQVNRITAEPARASDAERQVTGWSPAEPALIGANPSGSSTARPEVAARLRSLGYASGGSARTKGGAARPDPKDRITIASQMALVTSGEVTGDEMVKTLESILRADAQNPQAHLRLGYAEIERGQCGRAEPHLRFALQAKVPSADAGIGLAGCLIQRGDRAGAGAALQEARRAEPGNPVVAANLGLVAMQNGDFATATSELRAALQSDPLMLEARFALARALASSGDRQGALREATKLLAQLPKGAPQRSEVERLISALQ